MPRRRQTYDALLAAFDRSHQLLAANRPLSPTRRQARSVLAAARSLLTTLRQLAVEAGHEDASEAAACAYLAVRDEIDRIRDDKVREQRRRQRRPKERAARKKRMKPSPEWVLRLVRQKAHELGIGHMRASRHQALSRMIAEMPIDEVERRVMVREPPPIEQRAVEIVCGAPMKAKKNRIESKAIKLAKAVKAEWFAEPQRPTGRPKGSRIGIMKRDHLPSVSEVIAAVSPTIQELAGAAASTARGSAMITAIVVSVQAAGLGCPPGLAADLVRRLRRRRASA